MILLYGKRPDLANVEVSHIAFSWNGSSVRIAFNSDFLPNNPPKKWGIFNTVNFILEFWEINQIEMKKIDRVGFSQFKCDNDLFEISGAVELKFRFKFAFVSSIQPTIIDKSIDNF